MSLKLKIKKGDQVVVTTGRDRGKTGEVLEVLPKENRVKVQGINIVKRHTKPSQTQPGGIVEKEATIHVSNISHIDPKTKQPTRIGYKFLADGRKVRFAKRSGELIDV
ncbi:50S ribosomal protein L24 [Elstera litoralis]|jgi:large subunit ribosomal protein L24|uniref:Large ribosomal subunit protein uL24 n=1 Tax=Elstera litoralis TaxID=552518 RepID=A0A0F3INR8_9PROT|nr:50S ribosomal protein L24 [Elstera litoralis]KJV08262.1 50S ribosomal protein L24 [Elstera litoralis]